MAKKIDLDLNSLNTEVEIRNKLVEELLSNADPSEIFGKEGLFQQLKKQLVSKILEKEMESHIGYEKHSKSVKASDNRRNGTYAKTIIDEEGNSIAIEDPYMPVRSIVRPRERIYH